MQQPSHSSRRELTRSSQNEPSSSAACQWNVSTLTKSWEVTKLKLFRLYKAAVLPRASSSPDTEWTIDQRAAFLSSPSSSTSGWVDQLPQPRPQPALVTKYSNAWVCLEFFYQ